MKETPFQVHDKVQVIVISLVKKTPSFLYDLTEVCLPLPPSTGIKEMCYHTWLLNNFKLLKFLGIY